MSPVVRSLSPVHKSCVGEIYASAHRGFIGFDCGEQRIKIAEEYLGAIDAYTDTAARKGLVRSQSGVWQGRRVAESFSAVVRRLPVDEAAHGGAVSDGNEVSAFTQRRTGVSGGRQGIWRTACGPLDSTVRAANEGMTRILQSLRFSEGIKS